MKIRSGNILYFAVGILWGVFFMFTGGVLFLRHSLIEVYTTSKPFDEVIAAIPSAVSGGWKVTGGDCPLPQSPDGTKLRIFKLCHPVYGTELTKDASDRKISALIPCSFAVYQNADGGTCVSRLNVSLFGRLIGGAPANVFPSAVDPEQKEFFSKILY